jgi:exodeoxyribonuclease-5
MRETLIYNNLCKNLGNEPTGDQSSALKLMADYICENNNDTIFLLTGYAGTGKTSVISSVVKTLSLLRIRSVLLAPTGRAAKVLSSYTGSMAFTIHKKIYRQKSLKDGIGNFVLDRNLQKNTFFIVDEASMISNTSNETSIFGSGRLLDDLIEYVYSGVDCKLIIVGDTAQLPPVGSGTSPALDNGTLGEYGFRLVSTELKQVVRQSETSGILMNATNLRLQIAENALVYPEIDCINFSDILRISGEDLIEEISSSYGSCGLEGTIIVVNSNKQANRYNKGIRNRVFFREEEICPGDMVMVVKNNYYVTEEESGIGFIANGDIAEIKRIRKYEERYGFRFAEMTLYFRDYNLEMESKVLLDVLDLDTPALPSDRSRELFQNILADYVTLKTRKKQFEAVREDKYFNALQIKFAYAVTCHKSQGGQWERVFIDQGMFNRNEITMDYLRWFYTALTRSTERVYLVNFSDDFFISR